MSEKLEVVWPQSRVTSKDRPVAPRLDTLNGKTVCGLFDGVFRFDETWPQVKELLAKKYPGVKFVDWDKFGVFAGSQEGALHKALPEKLKRYGCDAVISGRGC